MFDSLPAMQMLAQGSAAQLVSLAAVARSVRPDVEIVLESHAFDLDAPRARELGIGIVGHPGRESGRRIKAA